MAAEITLAGWGECEANLNSLQEYFGGDGAREVSEQETLEVAADMVAEAKRLAPVRTGLLQSKIEFEKTDEGVVIRSGAPYSLFVEFGTIRTAAQPFFRPAFMKYGFFERLAEKHRGEIEKRIGRI